MKELKRCFIENDLDIIDFDREFFEEKTGVIFEDAFDVIVLEASENKEKVWQAVMSSDEIWMSTSFVGSSDILMGEMLSLALKHDVRDKKVINLNEWKDAAWHLSKEHRDIMWAMEDTHNVKFIFKDDYDLFKDALNRFNISTH